MFDSDVYVQGDHESDNVELRLLFRIDYCLPRCGRKCSEGKQDEQQELNEVSHDTNLLSCDSTFANFETTRM